MELIKGYSVRKRFYTDITKLLALQLIQEKVLSNWSDTSQGTNPTGLNCMLPMVDSQIYVLAS